ncbi:MAG: hypothetical protein ISQ07_09090 [Pirellulales bacterium]|nr:hypothetical protein [Pirellulales bacterium]
MRILARFPDIALVSHDAARAVRETVSTATAEPAATAADELSHDDVSAMDKREQPELVEQLAESSTRQQFTGGLVRAVRPRRRGLRQPPVGWGSIAFLAILAAGVWGFAWWQDFEAGRDVEEAAMPRATTAALEVTDEFVR